MSPGPRRLLQRLLAFVALAAATASCAGPPGAELCAHEPDLLARDPVYVALEIQDTVHLDEQLVEVVEAALDRARAVDPHFYRIHAYPAFWPDRLFLWSTRPQVTDAWTRGDLMTGVAEVDALLAEYSAAAVEPAPDRPGNFTLTFAQILNTPLLLERFAAIEGIEGSVLWMFGDSDNIHAVEEPFGWRVTFVLGWGDCMTGCIYHHWWEVFVPGGGGAAVLTRERGESTDWFRDCVPVIPAGAPG